MYFKGRNVFRCDLFWNGNEMSVINVILYVNTRISYTSEKTIREGLIRQYENIIRHTEKYILMEGMFFDVISSGMEMKCLILI